MTVTTTPPATSGGTPVYSAINPRSTAPPVYVSRREAKGVLPTNTTVLLSQNAELGVPVGERRAILKLRGIGSVYLFTPKRTIALVPFTGAGSPISTTGDHAGQRLEHWQVTVFTTAFDATATVDGLITRTDKGCDLSATATVFSHGRYYRYAR